MAGGDAASVGIVITCLRKILGGSLKAIVSCHEKARTRGASNDGPTSDRFREHTLPAAPCSASSPDLEFILKRVDGNYTHLTATPELVSIYSLGVRVKHSTPSECLL